jgi:predicted kinase
MLIAMAGLPGTGKSTLAARLAVELGGVVLCKDVVRATLFPAPVLDYSAAQDDIAMGAVYAAAAYNLKHHPATPVIIDGRTFRKAGQTEALRGMATTLPVPLRVIECVCADEVAHARIEADHATGTHPAGNRNADLYDRVKTEAVPLTLARLTLDTGELTLEECVKRALEHLRL